MDVDITRLAQLTAIGTAGLSAGMTLGISYMAIPQFINHASPATALQQWDALFERGKATGPPVALLSLSAFAYLAYTAPTSVLARAYMAAGACVISIVPYTFIAIDATNSKLKERVARVRKAAGKETEDATEVQGLLRRWSSLNYGRGMFPLVGMGLALWAVLP